MREELFENIDEKDFIQFLRDHGIKETPSDLVNENARLFQTKFGFDIYCTSFSKAGLVCFKYTDTASVHPNVERKKIHGVMKMKECISVIEQCIREPKKVHTKPRSIKILEGLTGCTAYLHHMQFGKWHISNVGNGQNFSLFNNPFGLTMGYTRGEDDFEILCGSASNDPQGYQPLKKIIEILANNGAVKPEFL